MYCYLGRSGWWPRNPCAFIYFVALRDSLVNTVKTVPDGKEMTQIDTDILFLTQILCKYRRKVVYGKEMSQIDPDILFSSRTQIPSACVLLSGALWMVA